ncbi:MAG TPA: zinc finger Ran-binding domain-containing protein [Candidatus Limnocylindrales bacterium]
MLDIWVCSSCHSVNRERATSCYKCGAPRAAATGEGGGRRESRAIMARIASPYRSTVELAVLAGLFLLIFVGVELWSTVWEAGWVPRVQALLDGVAAGGGFDQPAWDAVVNAQDPLAIPTLAAYLIATIAFGGWLSLSVANIPALGGGEPKVSPIRAFASSVIPFYNLRKVPAIVQEVLYRVDPRRGGVFMVGLAFIGLAGSWLVGRILGLYIDTRIATEAFNATSAADYATRVKPLVDLAFAVDVLVSGLIALGAVMLVVIMIEAERRAAARNREIEAELASVG